MAVRSLVALSVAFAFLVFVMAAPVRGQTSSIPCTSSMVSSFTPCLNFITTSTGSSGSSPTAACCTSLKLLTTNSTDCFCQILTGNMPFQVNRTLAVALPKACKMSRLPLQCKTTVAPIPAPGPIALSPVSSPGAPSSSIPGAESPASAPDADTGDLTPTENSGIRPVLTPSAAQPSHSFSTSIVFALVGVVTYSYYFV